MSEEVAMVMLSGGVTMVILEKNLYEGGGVTMVMLEKNLYGEGGGVTMVMLEKNLYGEGGGGNHGDVREKPFMMRVVG